MHLQFPLPPPPPFLRSVLGLGLLGESVVATLMESLFYAKSYSMYFASYTLSHLTHIFIQTQELSPVIICLQMTLGHFLKHTVLTHGVSIQSQARWRHDHYSMWSPSLKAPNHEQPSFSLSFMF